MRGIQEFHDMAVETSQNQVNPKHWPLPMLCAFELWIFELYGVVPGQEDIFMHLTEVEAMEDHVHQSGSLKLAPKPHLRILSLSNPSPLLQKTASARKEKPAHRPEPALPIACPSTGRWHLSRQQRSFNKPSSTPKRAVMMPNCAC